MSAPSAPPPLDGAQRPGPIYLARHGRPALDRSRWLSWRGYKIWWAAYDEGGLAPDQTPGATLVDAAGAADAIFSSPLRRSVETAQAVAGEKAIQRNDVFVEAPLPPPPLPGLRLPPKIWGGVARISWWIGFSGGQESRREAERRADAAVDVVLDAAQSGVVLVCAHGWFNRMMRPVLLARGWRCTLDGRDQYWSVRRYEVLSDP